MTKTIFIAFFQKIIFPLSIALAGWQGTNGQTGKIGLIDVDSIVAHSRIGDSSRTFIKRLLIEEEKQFKDSFALFEKKYALFVKKTETIQWSKKHQDRDARRLRRMQQKLECMDHFRVSLELLYEEELKYYISEELRRHIAEVKKKAGVAIIVTHKPVYSGSDNAKEESPFIPLTNLFIRVVEENTDFLRHWSSFREQFLVKMAALKLNMYQHCFNN